MIAVAAANSTLFIAREQQQQLIPFYSPLRYDEKP